MKQLWLLVVAVTFALTSNAGSSYNGYYGNDCSPYCVTVPVITKPVITKPAVNQLNERQTQALLALQVLQQPKVSYWVESKLNASDTPGVTYDRTPIGKTFGEEGCK